MKTSKIVSSVAVLVVGFGLAPSVLAADPLPVPSKGAVRFTEGIPENDLKIPEVFPEVVIEPPTDGNTGFGTANSMAILAPYLDFGEHAISQKTETYKAKVMEYSVKGEPTNKYYLPPMTVVKDLRGEVTGQWSVKVNASPFTDGTNTLGATIKYTNGFVFNDTKIPSGETMPKPTDQNVTADAVNFFKFTNPLSLNTTDQLFMSAKNGKGGGQTTLVPDTAKYDGAAISTNKNLYGAGDTVSGVELEVLGSSLKNKTTYTSTLTWTLSDTADF